MTPKRFERARELFDLAMELAESERSAFLARECSDDRELIELIRDLLGRARSQQADGGTRDPSAQDRTGSWERVVAPDGRARDLSPDDRLIGRTVGPYRIRGVLGQGGMGAVYEGEHERTRQVVALKLVRPGLTTPELLRRFEFELQVLARLEHPGIARIYHADTADLGGGAQPYFAMELVRGQNLIAYADEQKLTVPARLALVARIADAVQYAHQQGVIHRDLKPSNLFVTVDGQPKILDFGVARATDGDVQSTTLQTDIGQLIGTLPYMSPEQAGGNPNRIDTRSDVYALGVVTYELLTGRLPYLLEKRMIHEAVRIIREQEPTQLSSLNRTLRGDVETIVGKALEKDKERRYASANALAADIRRHLNDEPIAARPPSATDQLTKFARRNKVLVGGVAATIVALIAGLATSLVLYQRAEAEAERAKLAESRERGERERAETALAEVTRSRDETKQVSDFQSQMLSQIDTTKAGMELMQDVRERFAAALEKAGVPEAERTTRVEAFRAELVRLNATDTAAAMIDRTILKPAVKTIDEQFKSQPAVDASLRQALADLYREIGLYDAAFPLQESALATRRRVLGEEQPDTLTSIHSMGCLLLDRGKLPEAEQYLQEAMEKCRRVLGQEHPDTLTCIGDVGSLYWSQGKLAEAQPYFHEAMAISRRVRGDAHPDTLTAVNNMGVLLQAQGKFADAEPYYREAMEKRRRVLGNEHPSTLDSIAGFGMLLWDDGKLVEAEPFVREALDKQRRVLGEEHPITIGSINNMGGLLQNQGKFAEAEAYYREALEKRRRILGDEHPSTLRSINNMGLLLQDQGRLAEAEAYYREAIKRARPVLGEEHPNMLTFVSNMGTVLQERGELVDAEPYYREVLEKRRRVLGEEHADTLTVTANLGMLLRQLGRHQETVDLLKSAEPAARKVFSRDNAPRLAGLLATLGRAHIGLGYDAERFKFAESNLLEAHAIFVKARGETHKDTLDCIQGLVDLYAAWAAAEPGKGYDAKAAEWRAKLGAGQASTQPANATAPSP